MKPRSSSLIAGVALMLVALAAAALWLAGGERAAQSAIARSDVPERARADAADADELASLEPRPAGGASIDALPAAESRRASLAPSAFAPSPAPQAGYEPPPIPFHGRVLDRTSGAPVAGALVEVFANGGGAQDQEATTDSSGRFVLERRAWWWFYVRVSARGFATGFAVTDGVHRDAAQPLAIDLAPVAAVAVHLRLPDGSPLAGALVVALPAFEELRQRQLVGEPVVSVSRAPFEGTTDEHGIARIEGLPSGEVIQLEARFGGETPLVARRAVELVPGETREVDWRLGRGATVRVRVVDAAESAVEGAAVTLHMDAAARRASLGGASSTYDASSPEVERLFASGASTAAIEAFLSDVEALRGSATAPTLRTTQDGACAFERVAAGRYEVHVRFEPENADAATPRGSPVVGITSAHGARSPHGEHRSPSTPFDALRSFDVDDQDVEIVVRLERKLAIRGRVVGPAGAAVAGIVVQAVRGGAWISKSAQTAEDGSFEIADLAAGRWRVQARPTATSRGTREVDVEAGATDVELELLLEARTRLRIVDATTGTTLAGKILAFDGSTEPPDDLRTSVGGVIAAAELDAGETTFVAQTDDGRVGVLTANLAPGDSPRPLDVLVERGGLGAVRYLGPEPKARIDVVAGGAMLARCEIAAGQSIELLLPRGPCTVRAIAADGTVLDERGAAIHAGTTSNVVVGAPRRR